MARPLTSPLISSPPCCRYKLKPYDKVSKRSFFSHLYIQMTILPRQARDKHRESTQKETVFLQVEQDYTSLGNWEGYKKQSEKEGGGYVFSFSGGQTCWNGPARSATVILSCVSALPPLYSALPCSATALLCSTLLWSARFLRGIISYV
eukprot:COSAG06_NODE_12_length_35417_cov_270.698992_35_plen_149_part_00